MVNIKKTSLGLLLSTLFLFSLFIFWDIPYTKGITDDVGYTFENDVMYSGDGNFEYNETYNLLQQTLYDGHYNATYSFEDEADGTSGTDIEWIDTEAGTDSTYSAVITTVEDGHRKVIKFDAAGDNAAWVYWKSDITAQTSGTIEFWIKYIDLGQGYLEFRVYSTATLVIRGIFDSAVNKLSLYSGNGVGGNNITQVDIASDIWTHIRIDFDCGTDTQSIYVDGVLKVDDQNFHSDTTIDSINIFQFNLYNGGGVNALQGYVDAIGYSWDDDYEIGDNFLPYDEGDKSIYEVAGYEFAYDDDGIIYDIGTDNPSSWTDVEASGDRVNVVADSDYDRMVRFTGDTSGVFGLEKEFNIDEGIINITSEFYVDLNEQWGYLNYSIYSSDDTLITRLYFVQEESFPSTDIVLYYWDGASNIELYDMEEGIIEDYIYHNSFNLYINNYDGICVLSLDYYNSRWYETLVFPIIEDSDGLGKVECLQEMPTGSPTSYSNIDSIGVLINGSSIAEWGFPYVYYNLTEYTGDSWNLEEYNLFTLNATGIFSFYILGNFMGATNPTDYLTYNETERVFNLGNYTDTYVGWESYLYFRMNATSFSSFEIHSLEIEGVKLTEGTNEYYLELDYDNVNISENYFYVNNEKLYFYLDINDSSIEYIQATFDINDEMCRNGTISYKSYYIGYNLPYFITQFTDDSYSYYPISYAGKTYRYILPQEYVIDKFIVNISDYVYDNVTNNLESGYIEGYITDISFIFVWDIDLTLTIETLILGLVPLLIILIPTFTISSIFKGKEKDLILPLFIIMTIICYAGQIIPLWLFSSLLVNYGLLYIINKERR